MAKCTRQDRYRYMLIKDMLSTKQKFNNLYVLSYEQTDHFKRRKDFP